MVGAWLGFVGRAGFGWVSLVLPLLMSWWAVWSWRGQSVSTRWLTRTVACVFLLASLSVLVSLWLVDPLQQTAAGGTIGYLVVRAGRYYVGTTGTGLLAACVALLSWILIADRMTIPQRVGQVVTQLIQALAQWRSRSSAPDTAESLDQAVIRQRPVATRGTSRTIDTMHPTPTVGVRPSESPAARIRSTVTPRLHSVPTQTPPKIRQAPSDFQLPPLDLLSTPPPISERQLGEDLQVNAKILVDTLKEFGIEARCVHIDRGPAVTRYELAPAPGVKLTRIVSLADDLALVMKAANCHIVAPIPGKGLVGIEVPNSTAAVVYLREVLASREFQQLASPLGLAIGKDVSGQPVVADLRECPHLLVAGATGSGKTVCLNSLLSGVLHQASPDEVKFLMIDPKMVELVLFNEIPHLVAPVVTDAKRASAALFWAVQEMERRYQVLAKIGVRNIESYHERCSKVKDEGLEHLPYVVIVIDELADLMMVVSRDVEEAITRLSQLSRAVGIHMLLATQRPSVDVITGVIKANFPARIAFQVPSKVDSRTILDANGADKLLGRGDLLFLRPGQAKPIRAQGSFVTDAEIERVVSYVKSQRQPSYEEPLIARQDKPVEALLAEKDELYDLAKRLVLETRQASTSLLQRRLRLGYARAARILDLMEQEGLVGPPQGSRPREILIDEDLPAPYPSRQTGAVSHRS